ncbi:hypothetical protein AUJ84_00605 [Candidatus Pacearchaeota archaeon CG1_02_32_132]|nr:MAG: hypothetical protein AUJ84_00605 [Candidatus Pacearchaeota archaeon CG1_02_32_132]
MKYWKEIHLPMDVDERRKIFSGLEGTEVIVGDAIERKGYGMQGIIGLSNKGSRDFYFLRSENRSIPLRYSDLRELQVLVKFASAKDDFKKELEANSVRG